MLGLRFRFAQMPVRSLVFAFVLLACQPVLGDAVEVAASPQDAALNLLDRVKLEQILATKPNVTLRGFALGPETTVDLELSRFSVTTARTRFVVGGREADRLFAFDPDGVLLLRGRVAGRAGSRVVLALSEHGSTGLIDLGEGGHSYRLSGSQAADGGSDTVQLRVSPLPALDGVFPGVSLCGVSDSAGAGGSTRTTGVVSSRRSAGADGFLPEVTQQIELAIETDYEFFQLFGNLDAAAAYVVELYAVVGDIFLRDVNTRMVLTYVRLWDTPDDLFNEPNPLVPFRQYWNENMGLVQRDVAQFLSGRRDLPYGGIAYLNALCGEIGYSVVGYVLGFFSDPALPGVHQYDIFVTAHELGHNCGTLHTHSYEVDTCNEFDSPPQRGTIMSYCSQTISGGNAVSDLRFHTVTQGHMRDHVFEVECVVNDCNGNDIDDEVDIAEESSADVNTNGIPDECEDCNGNGVLDDGDIDGGGSLDLNANRVPDECEPDCNGNEVPDDLDIAGVVSEDLDGNNIPDSCQEDCDEDGVSDYNQIQADMSLDIDRNAALDACQDCDGDGLSDLDALGGTRNTWVASLGGSTDILEFHVLSGVRVTASDATHVVSGQDVLITPEARIFVSSADTDRIVEFDAAGVYVGDFVEDGDGGLDYPTGMVVGPTGNLLVASRDTDSVLEYDGQNGDFLRVFAQPASGGLDEPFGLAFGPNGNLFVTSSDNRVIEYNGETGDVVGEFVTAEDNGGLLVPRGLLFKPDGNLIVASYEGDEVLEYDGDSGAFVGKFNLGGTEAALTLDGPWCLRLGWDGQVYVSRHLVGGKGFDGGGQDDHGDGIHRTQELHVNSTRIYVFKAETGKFTRSYILGNDTGLAFPTGFDFMPDVGGDCNFNLLPDSCDIDSGASGDLNGNGTPDECECRSDLDGDGMVAAIDLALLLGSWGPCGSPCVPGVPFNGCAADLTGDCTVAALDLALLLGAWGPCD